MQKRSARLISLVFAAALAGCTAQQEPAPVVVTAYAPPTPVPAPLPEPAADELDCLAKTIYFEARGESEQGQRGVAAVVLNRVDSQDFPDTVCEVVHQGGTDSKDCQFSWWCDGLSDEPKDKRAWERSRMIAREMLNGAPDPTNGALYFHHAKVSPSWRTAFKRMATIGAHIYYR